ncbi:uncharacterized protein LOC128227924 isoform X2 [Mya arenaria]|nr:uncharacterized protein LOC128227924 isoform X2 [Mya arenaria]XP_052794833.1 uncharacterized protein LOC128227924 isoform X2 [Mya arenaria]XP_052794834.1 uncharacterized protein LOC128227924 isoform X2 [Mya arenaria]
MGTGSSVYWSKDGHLVSSESSSGYISGQSSVISISSRNTASPQLSNQRTIPSPTPLSRPTSASIRSTAAHLAHHSRPKTPSNSSSNSLNKDATKMTAVKHHQPLGTRPSVIIGNIEKQNLNKELELEDNVIKKTPALKNVFAGFEEAEKALRADKDPNNFGRLFKLLTDKVLNIFTKYSKDDERTVMANKLARSNFVEEVIDYYGFILDELDIEAVQNAFIEELHGFEANPPGENVKEGYNLILTIREILWNFSDSSHRFSETISETSLFSKLVHDLQVIYEHEFDEMQEEGNPFAFSSAVGILHNCARNPDVNDEKFRSVGAVEALSPFLECKLVYVKMVTVLVLGNIVTEQEVSKLAMDVDVIDFLLKAIGKAINARDRKEEGFHLTELIDGLASMARSDENKNKIMAKEDIAAMTLKILNGKDSSESEILASVKLIWELSFLGAMKQKFIANKQLMSSIEKLQKSVNNDIKLAAGTAHFVLRGKDQRLDLTQREESNSRRAPPIGGVPGAASKPAGKHIMISYCWSDKEMVLRIYQALVAANLKIWIDVQEMHKYMNVLEGMARAVEEASIILVCFSDKYKQSRNCRTEAEYLFAKQKEFIPLKMQRGYQADGWLGALIGVKLYIEFSNHYPFDQKLRELSTNIVKLTKQQTEGDSPSPPPLTQSVRKRDSRQPSNQDPAVKDWSKTQVEKWTKENGMEGSSFKKVRQLSGRNLQYLHHVYGTSTETFYRWIETKLDLKTLDDFNTFEDAVRGLKIH